MKKLILLITILTTTIGYTQVFTPPGDNTKTSMSIEDGLLRINRAFYEVIDSIEDAINTNISESTAEFYRREAYSLLYGNGGWYGIGTWFGTPDNHVLDMASDDAVKGTDAGDQPDMTLIETYQWSVTNTMIKGKWDIISEGLIAVENSMRILGQDKTQTNYAALYAELLFLRAYFNFEKKRVFNSGTWSAIIDDYDAAILDLPSAHSANWPKGRPIYLMAHAMLGKVYLYKKDYTLALSNFTIVINSAKYSLLTEMTNNWRPAYESSNTESIWAVNYLAFSSGAPNVGIGAGIDTDSKPRGLNHPYIAPWGCCGFFQASQNLVDFYRTNEDGLPLLDGTWADSHVTEPNGDDVGDPIGNPSVDPRLDFTLGRPGILFNNFSIHQTDYVRDLSYAGPYSTKKHIGYPEDFGINGWGNLTGVDYHIMRYADLLLMAAEAAVELGSVETARSYVNQVRQRTKDMTPVKEAVQGATRLEYTTTSNDAANYNIDTYSDTWTNKSLSRTAVRYERRLELALEGHRMFDLWRWNVATSVLNNYLDSEDDYRTYLSGRSYSESNNLPTPN